MDGVDVQGFSCNTKEEVGAWLAEAREIMCGHDLDPEENPLVTVKLLELLAAKTMVTLQRQPVPLDPSLAAALRSPRGRH